MAVPAPPEAIVDRLAARGRAPRLTGTGEEKPRSTQAPVLRAFIRLGSSESHHAIAAPNPAAMPGSENHRATNTHLGHR